VGTVRAAQTSPLSAQLLANIVEIRASEGAQVRKGEILVVLDSAQARAGLERAQAGERAAEQELAAASADYELASATLHRYESLFEKKSVSPQEFDEVKGRHQAASARRGQAEAGLRQAQASVAQAATLLEFTRIRAPFDAVVTEKRAEVGMLAAPGMPLLVVEDTRRLRLEATVNETDITAVRLNQPVAVVVDALGANELSGRVAQIVPAAEAASRSFLVKIDLPGDARLRSGLFGRARFARGKRSALLVPQAAGVKRGQLDGVYVVGGEGTARLRFVTLGKPLGEQVEVLSGLEAGERIVAAPGERDLAGKRVESGRP
jgi:RND family efflux transporter MFP subunit